MPAHPIDVRCIPTWQRHREIFAAFDTLHPGDTLRLITDHEPRPLRYEFDLRREGRFTWQQQQHSDDEWHVTIRRLAMEGRDVNLGDFFARCALLHGCNETTRAALRDSAVERSVARRQTLIEHGEEWPYLGFVREGTLAMISGSVNGRDQLLFEILPFETFGEIALVDGGAALGHVSSPFGSARIVVVPRNVILRHLDHDVALVRALAVCCAQRARVLTEHLVASTGSSIVERIARALLPYAPPDRGLAPALAPVTRMTQSQVATAAGTVREVAARALLELEDAGAVKLDGGRIMSIDRAKLSSFL